MVGKNRILARCSIALAVLCGGCGSLSFEVKPKLTVGMLGVFTTPTGATGNNLPKSETFTMTAATLQTSDGQSIPAFAGTPMPFNILGRSQIILEFDLSSIVGTSINQVTLTFDPALTAVGKYNSAMTGTLAKPTATYTVPLAVTKNKTFRLDISVDWQNTVLRDDTAKTETLQSPTLEIGLGDDSST